jgi:hypothetical protein
LLRLEVTASLQALPTVVVPVREKRKNILTVSGIEIPSAAAVQNAGARVTRFQQVKILCSTSLAAFTIVGKSSFSDVSM